MTLAYQTQKVPNPSPCSRRFAPHPSVLSSASEHLRSRLATRPVPTIAEPLRSRLAAHLYSAFEATSHRKTPSKPPRSFRALHHARRRAPPLSGSAPLLFVILRSLPCSVRFSSVRHSQVFIFQLISNIIAASGVLHAISS